MANGTDGPGRRPNNGAQRRTAAARRCPTCGRGGALVSVRPRSLAPGETTTYCRWDDCGYARVIPVEAASEASVPRALSTTTSEWGVRLRDGRVRPVRDQIYARNEAISLDELFPSERHLVVSRQVTEWREVES